ncbi:hypothetical protein A8B98_01420 [Hymenobacter sp. UV11]|nr:hypothetical protein A8B98_01420 [Hymenobacter sp. UV11]
MLIEEIRVQGYKSLVDATLHVRPLTLLAGTNSSGKSSIMQPILLIKQTMEAPYQPVGALVLDGAHVQAETAKELLSKLKPEHNIFSVIVSGRNIFSDKNLVRPIYLEFAYELDEVNFLYKYQRVFQPVQGEVFLTPVEWKVPYIPDGFDDDTGKIIRENAFLGITFYNNDKKKLNNGVTGAGFNPTFALQPTIANIAHIPGLRNAPKRNYVNSLFDYQVKGTFDSYVAGTINQWQQQNNIEALAQLNNSLQRLGLTNAVMAKVKNANEVELSVNRLPSASKAKPRKADMVNIADVGIGVSQLLPILVALIAAQEGQIVYIEQPELHLHPRAQVAMGELLAEAANRGVRVIVETHSSLLLLTIQTLIAQGKIANTDVGLHWFTRDAKGATNVQYVVPDEDGAYGEWPEDFSEIELKAQDAYLTAVGLRQFGEAAK